MRPALAFWGGSLVVLAGCGRASIQTVFIDVERVASHDPLWLVTAPANPATPPTPGSTQGSISALPARRLDFSGNEARLAKVQAAVEEARERTVRDVARQLREAYQREIDAVESKRMAEIDPLRKAAFEKAWGAVRARFEQYANARAKPAIIVALYAGFPDPDPESRRKPDQTRGMLVRRYERAREARETLVQLDASWETDVRRLLASFDDEVADALTGIRVEIESLRADAEVRARRDALAQAEKLTEQIESVVSGKAIVELPARPSVTITTPASPPLPQPPTVDFPTYDEANQKRLEAVRSDARIWAAHHGVVLSDSPRRGADRTADFIAWRKLRRIGP